MKSLPLILSIIAATNMIAAPVLAQFRNTTSSWSAEEGKQLSEIRNYTERHGYTLNTDAASKKAYIYDPTTNKVVQEIDVAKGWNNYQKAELAKYRNYLEPMGYVVKADFAAKVARVYEKGSNKLAMEIPLAEEKVLRKFSPNALNKRLLDEMIKVKAAGGAAWSHTMKNIAPESFIFFFALGGVMAMQLITNYSQNPVAMKHHIEHSFSPLGVVGFGTFMLSQGITSNLLSMYIKNPKFHTFIPYLGMSVGAFMQSYLSQVASDPNVKACAKEMLGFKKNEEAPLSGSEADPCSKAYEYLIVQKKIWEFAPGIVSMLASTALAGFGEKALTRAALKLTGVDIATMLMPGKAQLTGIKFVLAKGLQISAFTAIDHWLNRKVTYAWKNFFDGEEFHEINKNLVAHVNAAKFRNWNDESGDLKKQLEYFTKKMSEWRMVNLAEAYEAHQNWKEALEMLTSMYDGSQNFYKEMALEIRNTRFEPGYFSRLKTDYPYFGIKVKDWEKDKNYLFFTRPRPMEFRQMETLAEAATYIESALNSPEGKSLRPFERNKLMDFADKWKKEDREAHTQSLQQFINEIKISRTIVTSSGGYPKILNKIYSLLGSPEPMIEPGRGFFANYLQFSQNSESAAKIPFYRQNGAFKMDRVTDYFLMQMICGPDAEKGESTIKTASGFPAVFLPPTIRTSRERSVLCESSAGTSPLASQQIYTYPFENDQGTRFKGGIEYILAEARDSAISKDDTVQQFESWWKKNTEVQILKAFEKFGMEYDQVIGKMFKTIYQQDLSVWNRGPVANGTMNSAFQEERVYLSLLKEIIEPSKKYEMDLSKIMSQPPTNPLLKKIEQEFAVLNYMLKKIKITEVDGQYACQTGINFKKITSTTIRPGDEKTRAKNKAAYKCNQPTFFKRYAVESPLENYEFEEQVGKIQTVLSETAALLNVNQTDVDKFLEAGSKAASEGQNFSSQLETEKSQQLQLTKQQHDLAVTCLENLQALANELMTYGTIANAVSWNKIKDLKRANIEQEKFNNEFQKKMAHLRSLMMGSK